MSSWSASEWFWAVIAALLVLSPAPGFYMAIFHPSKDPPPEPGMPRRSNYGDWGAVFGYAFVAWVGAGICFCLGVLHLPVYTGGR